jgi:drug/metabolite transporter (DMT)-like permease
VSSAAFATLSILAKLAFAGGISLPVLLGLRFSGAAAILLIYLVMSRSRIWLGGRRSATLLALGGVGYAGQSTLYFLGLQRAPASLSSLLLYVYPAFVALLGWVVERRPPRASTGWALGLALAGVALTVGGGSAVFEVLDPIGPAFVLCSAAAYAVYILASHRLVPQGSALVATFWIATGAGSSFLSAAAVPLVSGSMPFASLRVMLTPNALLLIAAMSLFSTVIPLTTFLAGMARVGPTAAALLSTLEPVFTVGLAALVLDESLTVRQGIGGALVLGAVILLQVFEARRPVTSDGLHK